VAAPEDLEAVSRLAAIVESSTDAMIGKTLDGVITSWNAGAERMYGYAPEEIIGRNISLLVPSDRPDEVSSILRRVARGERVEHFETERIRKSGEVFDVSVTISPIRNQTGDIVGASTVARDISDRKRAEAELRDVEKRLHQAQRLESVGQLAGGIAHDFNNLLAGIMNYSALAADGLAELTRRLGLGGDTTAVTLSNDIAEIARRHARRAADAAAVDLQPPRSDRVGGRRRQCGGDRHGEPVAPNHRREHRPADATRARSAPDDGRPGTDRAGDHEPGRQRSGCNGRRGHAANRDRRLRSRRQPRPRSRHHSRSVRSPHRVDTGRGMPEDIAVRAFEPFFTTKPIGEGTGLGLATVYGIVTRAGGKVLISSRPGIGTNVVVILPATDATPTTIAEAPHVAPIAAPGETILLVEDEEMVREPTRRILANHGYAVLSANNVEEALRIIGLQDTAVDLLLTDVVMPGGSGTDLAAHTTGASPRTKILYMSGYASDVIGFQQAAGSGVNLIEKPFASAELLRRVREVLDRE
jgi:PAS domain S-box-containing protein